MPESLEDMDLLLLTLAPYVGGEPVTIRHDPWDLAEIRVYTEARSCVGRCPPETASVTVFMQGLQVARHQRRRELPATPLRRPDLPFHLEPD